MNFDELATQFENAIRRGEIVSVQNEIERLPASTIPRSHAAAFGDIARRVRSETWGLRLLRPIVRSEAAISPSPSDAEMCAYAGLLIKVGAIPEARSILEKLDEKKLDNVSTFLSQTYITEWNYLEASVHLKKLLERDHLSPYARCVTEVNLIGAFIFLSQYSKAQTGLKKVLALSRENSWDLLYGNALELAAQLAVIQGAWADADALLKEAEARSGQHSHYRVFIEKWRSLALLFQTKPGTPACEAALEKIASVRQTALRLSSWETARDLDYQVADFLRHQNLLLNVYFGTPFPEYKKRIEQIFKKEGWRIPADYFRKLSSAPATRVFDLGSGDEYGSNLIEPLKPGQMLHRFINILATDFYKPIGLGELFSRLFPDEFFNVDSSPDRVAQAVKQLRRWFETNHIPLDIQVENSRYAIKANDAYAFRIENQVRTPKDLLDSGYEQQLKQLMTKWPYQSFSASKAAAHLDLSASTVRTLLQRALDEKRLYQSGAGRSTLYRFEK